MSRLFITLPDTNPEHGTLHLTLEPPVKSNLVKPSAVSTVTIVELNFLAKEMLHDGNSLVVRGDLSWTGDFTGLKDVVCKLVPADSKSCKRRLEREAMLYTTKLAALQGTCVPNFIGYFTGVCHETHELAACILLEYCGELVEGSNMDNCPMEIRVKAFQSLQKIHAAGVQHNDLDERFQVVIQGDEVRFIDFDRATKHKCEACNVQLYPYDFEPGLKDLPCEELYDFALNTDIWTLVGVEIMYVPILLYKHSDVESLLLRCRSISSLWSDDVVTSYVCRMLDEYCKQYRDRFGILFGPVEEGTPAAAASALVATNPNAKTAELRYKLAWLKDWSRERWGAAS